MRLFFSVLILFAAVFANLSPAYHEEYFSQGDKALLEGNFEKAIAHYLKGMLYAKPRESVIIKDDLGYAYLQLGKLDRAKDYLKSALNAFPENYNIRFYLGIVYLIDGKYDLAEEEFKMIEENVYFDDRWVEIAKSSQIYNKLDDRVIESQWKRLRKERGVALHAKKSKNHVRPEKILDIDAFDDKNQGIFCFAQAAAFRELGHTDQAQTKFLEAKRAGYEWDKLIPSLIHHRLKGHDIFLAYAMHEDFFKTLRSGRLEAAISKLEKTLQVDEESPEINHNLALLYLDQSKLEDKKRDLLEKAEVFCARALWFCELYGADREQRSRYLELMGNIYFFQDNYERSAEEFQEMLKANPKDANTHYNLGCVHYHQNLFDLAESDWLKAINLDQKKFKKEDDEETPEEERSFTVTVRKRSVSFFARTCLGKLYLEQNQPEKAILILEGAIKLKPRAADPYFDLAKVCHSVGQDEKALSHLERYLFLGGSKEKAEELERLIRK
jgi:tetratricopeptide (TPR) repeat protein